MNMRYISLYLTELICWNPEGSFASWPHLAWWSCLTSDCTAYLSTINQGYECSRRIRFPHGFALKNGHIVRFRNLLPWTHLSFIIFDFIIFQRGVTQVIYLFPFCPPCSRTPIKTNIIKWSKHPWQWIASGCLPSDLTQIRCATLSKNVVQHFFPLVNDTHCEEGVNEALSGSVILWHFCSLITHPPAGRFGAFSDICHLFFSGRLRFGGRYASCPWQ